MRLRLCLAATFAALACAACQKPEPPRDDQPPAPQAASNANTGLRDAVRDPIERAKAADAQVQRAADAQRAAIRDAGG